MCVCLVTQSCLTLCNPLRYSPPGSSLELPGKNTGVACHFSPPGDLPNPGFKLASPLSPALHANSLPAEPSRTLNLHKEWKKESEVAQSCQTLFDPWTVACWVPSSMGFSRQEYWSGLPFPSPVNLPDPGIKPGSPTLQADFTIWATRESLIYITLSKLSIQHQTLKIKGCKNP